MDAIYNIYALLAVVLGCTTFAIGVWAFMSFHFRANSHYMGIMIVLSGTVGIFHFISMISTSEQMILFWQRVAWSATIFCPSAAGWSLLHYRGFRKFLRDKGITDIATRAEAGLMTFMFGTTLILLAMIWLSTEAFFEQTNIYRVGQFSIVESRISYGHEAYIIHAIIALLFMVAFTMRFFALEERFSVGSIIVMLVLIIIGFMVSLPISINSVLNPSPNLSAISYPIIGLIWYILYVRFKPDIHLHYAVAMHPTAWHDLRNLATAVQRRMALLKQYAGNNEDLHDELLQIEHAIGELHGYIRQVRVPRPTRLSQIQKDDVLVTDVVEATTKFWGKIAFRKGIQWDTSLTTEAIILTIDPTWFKRTLDNLIQNAIKFTPPNGRITVHSIVEQNHYVVKVKDTGIGISVANQAKVFDDYYRGENASNYEGDGLGLASVTEFAKYHDGTITLNSELGQGTTFTLSLPLD